MCDPVTLTVLAVSSIALSAAGQIQQGKAAKAQANFQAQIAENNSIIAGRAADDARERGRIAAGERDVKTRQFIGKQRVALASSGQEVDIGSGLEITSDTAALGKLDSLRIINNAEREAIGLETQSANFTADATAKRAAGKNAKRASELNALNSLVSGAATTGFQFASLGGGGSGGNSSGLSFGGRNSSGKFFS